VASQASGTDVGAVLRLQLNPAMLRPIGADIPCRKALDFRCKQSVTVVMLMRAFWPHLGSRPAGDTATVGLRW
jgi:hypothetical protein